jgi:acetyl-CoA synthetase
MRRILRKVAAFEEDGIGDTSTLADPTIVAKLIDKHREARGKNALAPTPSSKF